MLTPRTDTAVRSGRSASSWTVMVEAGIPAFPAATSISTRCGSESRAVSVSKGIGSLLPGIAFSSLEADPPHSKMLQGKISSDRGEKTAIDRDALSGDVGRGVGGEEDDDAGKVLEGAEPSLRDLVDNPPAPALVAVETLRHGRAE